MLPRELKSEQFVGYPPAARSLAEANIALMKQLPLSFLPSLLRQVVDYDVDFPAERKSIDRELGQLASLSEAQIKQWFAPFAALSLSQKLIEFNWIDHPAQFLEQQSAYLWSTHQMDAFRKAATEYGDRLASAASTEPLPVRRIGIAIIGQGVAAYDGQLFANLRRHGTFFEQVKSENGVPLILEAATARARAFPIPYGHWYVDGGAPAEHSPLLTSVSYQGLEPTRNALLKKVDAQISRPGMGPEELRSYMALLSPADLGMNAAGDPVLDRFQVKLLTEGSGTQIFSTTFVQWTAREALRRAQPLTLVARFAARQRQKPMNEMLSGTSSTAELDFVGSLVDADMGSYYHWINQQRLPGSEHSGFLAWFEGHNQALVIAPGLPRDTTSRSAIGIDQLLALTTT
jgi:hypothetical protein